MGVYAFYMKSHYEDKKIKALKRLNIIKGQLEGLARMIERDEYCVDVLNQSLAIQKSLKSLDAVLFERHITAHVQHQMKHETEKATQELNVLFKNIHR
jgi:CsoR family transcriptional regulator, copper-sensing transcriptional repressor